MLLVIKAILAKLFRVIIFSLRIPVPQHKRMQYHFNAGPIVVIVHFAAHKFASHANFNIFHIITFKCLLSSIQLNLVVTECGYRRKTIKWS